MRTFACGCVSTGCRARLATDAPIEASPEDVESIQAQLRAIEQMLAPLYGVAYSREPASLQARAEAGDVIERHFDGIVEDTAAAIERILDVNHLKGRGELRPNLSNALVRFIAHLRDPSDIRTYIYLRKHSQEGMLSRAKPSQFNVHQIALKQVLLRHARAELGGWGKELVQDVIVAAIDERRLMVAQFYIESREYALRISEERYRNSIDHAPDPMYELDPETWVVIGANAAAAELHRTMPGERQVPLLGQPWPELVSEKIRPETLNHLQRVVRDGVNETMDLPLGGRYFDVNSALIPLGSRQFIHMILHDVTQRREILDELVKAERLAAVGTFAAGVAHEVNNPLGAISSLVQSMLQDETNPSHRTALQTILSQIIRISTTLKDLVNFARPSAARRSAVDLNPLIEETLRLVAYDKRFKGISFERELAPDLRQGFADKNEIQQLLLNLLFNAADAIRKEGGVIRLVTANQSGGQNSERVKRVTMRVADNGVGIPPQNLERVLDPFFTTKPAGSGVGLGLAICQRIVLANHGTMKIDSEAGKGTAVTICLPVHEGGADVQAASSPQ